MTIEEAKVKEDKMRLKRVTTLCGVYQIVAFRAFSVNFFHLISGRNGKR
jgi:hypothetical protein